jgi:hypothetical protein
LICPIVHLQSGASPGPLQITTVVISREPQAIDGQDKGSVKKLEMNKMKRFAHHQGKHEIRQNIEVQFWNGLGSEFAPGVPIKVLKLTSERIRHFRRNEPRPLAIINISPLPYLSAICRI